jgi:hypothetical protein
MREDGFRAGAQPRRNFVRMSNTPSELPVVVQKAYEFSLWMIRKVESFPVTRPPAAV